MRSTPWTRCSLAVLAALLLGGPASADLIINELEYDQPSYDYREFLELYNPGTTAVSLDGWTIEFFNGNAAVPGTLYSTVELPATDSVPPQGYYVIGSPLVKNVDHVAWTLNGIQNGGTLGDGIALLNNGVVVEAFSYDASADTNGFTAIGGEADGTYLFLIDVVDTDTNSLQRIPDGGVWTKTLNNTPGASNFSGPAAVGACCLQNSTCVPDVTEMDCLYELRGTWRGDGIPCMDIVAFVGCLAGPVAPVSSGWEIWDLNGSGHVDLADFALFQQYTCTDTSPVGACCIWPDEDCLFTSQADCNSNGGVFAGTDSSCQPNPCVCVSIADAPVMTYPDTQLACITGAVINNDYDLIHSVNSKNFHIQDPTGIAGLTVFGSNANIDALLAVAQAGDQIRITGFLNAYFNTQQMLSPFTIEWLGSPGVPTPFPVSIADLENPFPTNGHYVNTLIVLENVTFDNAGGTFAYGNLTVRDANDPTKTLTCRIANGEVGALPIVGTTIPSGPVDVVGVCAIYNDLFQVMPRVPGDITPH